MLIIMNKVIVIRGPLGVGKTTVAKILTDKIQGEYLSLDKILKDNNLDGEDGIPIENFLSANEKIYQLTRGRRNTIIIDGCFYYKEQIDDLIKRFDNEVIFISLSAHVEKCIERDSQRQNSYGEDSARFVHMITSKVNHGYEIENSILSIDETIDKIMNILSSHHINTMTL